MEKRELKFTTRLTREDVAGLIEALVEGLKDGHLKVQKSGDVLELAVPRVVDLKIEAEIDEERAEFEIEVSWMTNRAGSPDTVPEETPAGPAAGKAAAAAKKAPAKRSAALAKAKASAGKKASGGTAATKTPAEPDRDGKAKAGSAHGGAASAKKGPGEEASGKEARRWEKNGGAD